MILELICPMFYSMQLYIETALITRWIIPLPFYRFLLIIINDNDYPYTNLTIMCHQWCAMNPAVPSLATTKLRQPLDTRCDAPASHHGVDNMVTLRAWVANPAQKRGLQYPRDLERG